MTRRCLLSVVIWTAISTGGSAADVGNRLTYLDDPIDPYYVHKDFPRLITPQWVGQDGVEAVVVLAVDDLGSDRVERYETFLRPILDRLKQIDGRAGLSIMTNNVDPRSARVAQWLAEGVSIETHTADHPCPLLQKGYFPPAKATFDWCVERIAAIPNQQPVAFRMPCCDSMNSVSPRFFAEIFNRTTPQGLFLSIDSSVFQVFTAEDPQLPRASVIDDDGRATFAKYVPTDKQMVNVVHNYPYPFVIGRLCWEIPTLMPSDWDAFHLHDRCNPLTVRDMQRAIDATVAKQGLFALCFHPHNWIANSQIVELIDYAQSRHGGKIRFLSFRDVAQRLTDNLLGGHLLRDARGGDNGVRVLDVDNDGFLDAVIANAQVRTTRLWNPASGQWQETPFPLPLVARTSQGESCDAGVRFGVLQPSGQASLLVRAAQQGVWHFTDGRWMEDPDGARSIPCETSVAGRDRGVRLRDLDLDGICEWIVANPDQQAVYRLAGGWDRLPWTLPAGLWVVDADGRDAGLRFVDLEQDGHSDLVFSNAQRSAIYAFVSLEEGWSRQLLDAPRTDPAALPMIVRADGTNNGVWFAHRDMWVQNEDTGGTTQFHTDHRRITVQPEPTPAAR